MKTAEEWMHDERGQYGEWIRAIQLDAWKAGMTDAGEMVWGEGSGTPGLEPNAIALKIYKSRDNKTTL